MKDFLARFGSLITGVLSGFDRLVFRGSLLRLMPEGGLNYFLRASGIRMLDFKDFALSTTEQLKRASLAEAYRFDRPIHYLESPKIDKEDFARSVLAKYPVKQGLICVLKALEPCRSFEYHRSPNLGDRGFRLQQSKCLHLYKYYLHPRLGFMNARIQTWFPFNIQVCLNGREWLARQLKRNGSSFERADNCFTWLENPDLAQRLMTEQLDTDWPQLLGTLASSLNPQHPMIFRDCPMDYYWTAYQTEWATDLLFKNPRTLANLYPVLVRYAMLHFKSPDVMRFLGGKVNGNFTGEIVSSFKNRPEGVRVKHWLRGNSVKMYDKAGNVLRVETTVGKTTDFKVLRPRHDDPDGPLQWQPLRKGVADLHRRAQVSQRSNDAYLEALATVSDTTPIAQLFDAVSHPVLDNGRRVRAMRLSDNNDIALLYAVCRGEFAASGFRNRDIRKLLFPTADNDSPQDLHRTSGKVSRLLRLLRAHGIIHKIQKTHRYRLTTGGGLLAAAIFASRNANVKQLLGIAA